jgi:hypothetical protein
MQELEEHEANRWISLAIKRLPLIAICRKSWVFSGCSSFLPQGKLTGWVRINTCTHAVEKVITIVVKINSLG